MKQGKRATKEERVAFFIQYDKLLDRCSALSGKPLDVESQKLVEQARIHFDYSPTTYSRDIMGSLLRGWRRWKRAGTRTM